MRNNTMNYKKTESETITTEQNGPGRKVRTDSQTLTLLPMHPERGTCHMLIWSSYSNVQQSNSLSIFLAICDASMKFIIISWANGGGRRAKRAFMVHLQPAVAKNADLYADTVTRAGTKQIVNARGHFAISLDTEITSFSTTWWWMDGERRTQTMLNAQAHTFCVVFVLQICQHLLNTVYLHVTNKFLPKTPTNHQLWSFHFSAFSFIFRIIVGAPLADTSRIQAGVIRGGAVYRCDIAEDNRCRIIPFDSEGKQIVCHHSKLILN